MIQKFSKTPLKMVKGQQNQGGVFLKTSSNSPLLRKLSQFTSNATWELSMPLLNFPKLRFQIDFK